MSSVVAVVSALDDVRFRMLDPHEYQAAMDFPLEHHLQTAQRTRTAALEAQMDPLFQIGAP